MSIRNGFIGLFDSELDPRGNGRLINVMISFCGNKKSSSVTSDRLSPFKINFDCSDRT